MTVPVLECTLLEVPVSEALAEELTAADKEELRLGVSVALELLVSVDLKLPVLVALELSVGEMLAEELELQVSDWLMLEKAVAEEDAPNELAELHGKIEAEGGGEKIIPISTEVLAAASPEYSLIASAGVASGASPLITRRRPPVSTRSSSSCVQLELSSSTARPVCEAPASPMTLSERLRPPQST